MNLKFAFPAQLPAWFPGHMAKSLRIMEAKMADTHLFVEVRDARLPLTSINPVFQRFARREQGLQRLIVYCRRDLGDVRFEKMLQNAFEPHGDRVVFANTQSDADGRAVLREIIKMASKNRAILANDAETTDNLRVMIGGMPNVGKSSLLNALRRVGMHKAKAAFTGANPGVTRKVGTVVKVWEKPPVYIYDSPGVMVKFMGKGDFAAEKALKIALSSGMKDQLFSLETLAEYLLWRLHCRFFNPNAPVPTDQLPLGIQKLMPPLPMTDLQEFGDALARRLGALQQGGVPDSARALRWFLEAFRDGKLGGWALDDLTFTGALYARLPDGQAITEVLPAPAMEQTALLPAVPEELMLVNPSVHMHNLVIPSNMPMADRVNLSVSSYLAIEQQRFLYPHPANMSKHALKRAEKAVLADARTARFQRLGITSRPKHLNPQRQRTRQLAFRFGQMKRKRIMKRQGRTKAGR